MEHLYPNAVGRKANALHLGILLRLQIVAVRRKWLQAVSITFGEARAWQPLPETCPWRIGIHVEKAYTFSGLVLGGA